MLKKSTLKKQLKSALTDIYKPAIEQCILAMFPSTSTAGDKKAKEIATMLDDLTADMFAERLANCIDYYVRNISITGTVITTGSPVTQTARIVQAPMPSVAGKIPNTLGIS